jgi:uncharacterized repeat protein (TIGR04076 family)
MHELRIEVERVDGTCTGPVPMTLGRGFSVRNGCLVFRGGGPICLFALQSILPMIPAKERLADGDPAADWIGRVQHVQCPDPDGGVVWRIEQDSAIEEPGSYDPPAPEPGDLLIEVERIDGRCVEGTQVGDRVLVRESSIYLAQPFCLYALAAVLPILPAKERARDGGDWMFGTNHVACPDPLGKVILRIETVT